MLSSLVGISWATPFLLLALYGLLRFFIRPTKTDPDGINWTPIESIGVTIAIYFVSQIVGGTLLYLVPLSMGRSVDQASKWLDSNIYGQFLLVLVIEAIAVGMLYLFVKRRQSNFGNIGLRKPRWRDLGYVLLGFVIYFAGYIMVLAILKQVVPSINNSQPQQIGFDHPSHAQLPLVFISLVILPPIAEELMVRGFLYSGLKKGMPLIFAVLITSLIFASAHLQPGSGEPLLWSAAIDTFVLSLVLIYIKEKTGSLVACIGLHMLKNFIAFLGLFVFHVV